MKLTCPDPRIHDALLQWYRTHHRRLPWRETRDPYRILMSEVMLQQTQVERVVPKYHEFLARFPTLEALADAPTSDVIRAWSGLGYNRRALNVQRACREIVDRFEGAFPTDAAVLATLPGIGPYTAGAIACFAFEQDVGFVDTNIRRVLHRVLAGPELPTRVMTAREIEDAAQALVPPGQGYRWNQALMELGATICRARAADCHACPLHDTCAARPTMQRALAARPARRGEPRYETTSRFVRGRIVEALRGAPAAGLTLAELVGSLNGGGADVACERIAEHIDALVRDGLVVPAAAELPSMREEPATYDDGTPESTRESTLRYRLPD
jgi:A/G-specific adenine glycosylase